MGHNSQVVPVRQCCGAGPFLAGSGYFFSPAVKNESIRSFTAVLVLQSRGESESPFLAVAIITGGNSSTVL